MSGKQTKERIKKYGEVYTPMALVNEMLDQFPQNSWSDPTVTILEPACGNGNFLEGILVRCLVYLHPLQALNKIFALDILPDNITDSRLRLYRLCLAKHPNLSREVKQELVYILLDNVLCRDTLTYDMSFPRIHAKIPEELKHYYSWYNKYSY